MNKHMNIVLFLAHRYGAFSFGTEAEFVPEKFGENSPTLYRQLAVRGTAIVRPAYYIRPL